MPRVQELLPQSIIIGARGSPGTSIKEAC
jgi:hypothetical protein